MKIFLSFIRQSSRYEVMYRFDFWVRLFQLVLLMYSMSWVWRTLYTKSPEAFGVSLMQMVTYGVLGIALSTIISGGPSGYMSNQIRTGSIDTDLLKPLDFHIHMLARNAGEKLFSCLSSFAPAFVIACLLLQIQMPTSFLGGVQFGISLMVAYLVWFSIDFLFGLLCIVTLSIGNMTWAYSSFITFFSGKMVPTWFFPSWLEGAVKLLPFRCLYEIPMCIYIGKIAGREAWEAIGFQCIWAVLLFIVGRMAWSSLQARLIVQGG